MTKDKPELSDAYALNTPEDSRRLYADWAGTYDQSFARDEDYRLHIDTARAFVAAGGKGPVLDVGAGTGLCGAILGSLGIGPIDATDISAEMLDVAARKDIYRDAILADLCQGVPVSYGSYAGIISSGTFTTGHVGPEVFSELLRIARPRAVFALSVNAKHFSKAGFAAAFDTLQDSAIHDLTLTETRIYGELSRGAHKNDTALIACFRKS